MLASPLWEVTNSPEITAKSVLFAGSMCSIAPTHDTSLLIFERPEHLGDLSAGDLAGRVQLAVGAGDDPGGHHAC